MILKSMSPYIKGYSHTHSLYYNKYQNHFNLKAYIYSNELGYTSYKFVLFSSKYIGSEFE